MEGGDQQSVQGQDNGHWQYKPEAPAAVAAVPAAVPTGLESQPQSASPDRQSVTWTASEFVAHHKSSGWYALLIIAIAIAAALIYFISRDVVSTGAIVILAVIFGVAASRKPRVLTYQLDRAGLTIGQRFHSYEEFKSFALINEGAFTSISFMPLKRFMPPTSIYFSPEDEEKIIGVLAEHLPLQQGGQDALDRLMHRIRF